MLKNLKGWMIRTYPENTYAVVISQNGNMEPMYLHKKGRFKKMWGEWVNNSKKSKWIEWIPRGMAGIRFQDEIYNGNYNKLSYR